MNENKVNNEENKMDVSNKTEVTGKKKSSFGSKFVTFLSMGGFLVVLFLIVGIIIAISVVMNSCQGGT